MLQRCKISFFCCNITTFFDTIFSFYDGKSPNKIKFSLLLNVTETQTPLEDDNMKCCPNGKVVDWLNYTSFLLLFSAQSTPAAKSDSTVHI